MTCTPLHSIEGGHNKKSTVALAASDTSTTGRTSRPLIDFNYIGADPWRSVK